MKLYIKLSCSLALIACGIVTLHTAPAFAAKEATADGASFEAGGIHLRVDALREDVLRVRYWRGDRMPEDASWAVLPEARHSTTTVQQTGSGFSTSALAVSIDAKTLCVTVRDKAGNIVQQDAAPVRFDGKSFELSERIAPDAHFFGLGDKTGPMDRRGETFTLWNTDAYAWQESTDPLYKAIPFFMTYDSGRASGTLLDNTWRTHFDFGHLDPDSLVMGSVDGPVDYYVLYGPSPKQVLAEYAWLTGPTPMPPMWSLGFQQSRYSYMTQARAEEVAKRLRTDHIPSDAIYLDIDFQDRNRPFTVNTKTFPDLPGLVNTLHKEDMHLVVITDLHVANAPNQNYAPYDSGISGDHFVHNPDGTVYTGKVWPGPSVFPDFTQASTRAWWGTLYTDFVHMGIDGFWNDMNEPSVFDVASKTIPENVLHRIDSPGFAKRTTTHAEIHNVMGMENEQATSEGLLKLRPEERPFVLTRAAYAGTQRYAATWTGDNSATWNHLRMTTSMLKNLGLSGFSMAGADVGGYAGNPSPELLTKWIEIGAFQPIFRDHAEKGTIDHEVWANGPEQEAIRRRFIEERYRLMPYLYTTVEQSVIAGLPIVRPLFLEFPDWVADKHPVDIDPQSANEFLFGPDLLIAPPPVLEQTAPYAVHLPSDGWYDYWTGKPVEGERIAAVRAGLQPESGNVAHVTAVTVTPAAAELPVYVRPGSIIPYAPLTESTMQLPKGALTLRVYPGPDCHGAIYLDDGHSFAFRNGDSLTEEFTCSQQQEGGVTIEIGARKGGFQPWWSGLHVEVYGMTQSKPAVSISGRAVAATQRQNAVAFEVPDDGKGLSITVR